MIDVEDLSVHFGGVVSLDQMSIQFPEGACGLIGPNGAGKTTFFNVLSGFVTPRSGRIDAMGHDLLSMPDYKRARWGLRRTFQTEQAIEKLTVFDNVATVYEHSETGGKAGRAAAVEAALDFVGLTDVANETVRALGAKERRFIEVARAVVGTPKLILLDEPAAGLPDEETAMLGRIIHSIPERVGATVILVDHDMSLVQACCEWTAVLDFGRLLASGPTSEVLRDPNVMRAYLGTEEVVT
ncbi:MAG: branched-chain amino acid transport system ATP-binding protein [Ilumatobacteraceae bacterium]|nr:branched-chain amino acid transport system ATP-binding protein [Ilumatobacteraceae bacterium]